MSIPEPPSFDQIFNNQQNQRQSSGDLPYGGKPVLNDAFASLGPDHIVDEPHTLERRGSNASLHQYGQAVSGSSSGQHNRRPSSGSSFRKESLPFDPEQSSTLIATAPRGGNNPSPLQNRRGDTIGDIMFASSSQYPYNPPSSQQHQQDQQQHQQQQQQYQNQNWNTGLQHQQFPQMDQSGFLNQPAGFNMSNDHLSDSGTPNSGVDSFYIDQSSSFPSSSNQFPQQDLNQQNSGDQWINQNAGNWGQDFIGQDNGNQDFNWTGEGDTSGQMEGMLGDDAFAELERIISNSQAGSHNPSREGTPFPPTHNNTDFGPPDSSVDPTYMQNFDSAISSRSTSPYPAPTAMSQVISPPLTGGFRQNSQSPHPSSPHFNKPQSPPALIIPNQQHSPSPVLPHIVTATNDNSGSSQPQGNGGVGLGGASGGLFPPANPALEGLTGMAGISPIAPNADGPQIYIQPSTPISGLKDGRGIFDFKRVAVQNHHNQQGHQQQHEGGFNVPPPATHSISRHSSVEGLNAGSQSHQASPQPQQDFSMQDQITNQDWTQPNDMAWANLRPVNNGVRPRAKSDSQMGMTGVDMFNRQNYINNVGSFNGDGSDPWKNGIDNWRAAMTGQQQEPGPTVDPRSLPGQDTSDALSQLTISQQFSQLQAQRDRLPALTTAGLKYQPGQFSPTSLAFYQQLGMNPATASQLPGTSSAPFYQSTFQEVPQGQWPQTAGLAQQSFLTADQPGIGPRRRSFAEGTNHPAAGAGTPGYGVEFTTSSPFGTLNPGRIRGLSPGVGHRRAAKSEDLGRPGSGWGVGAGGSTSDFLSSITANDGTLLPPTRGRSSSHSRHSSASSVRSVSPALSISSQGSSYGHPSPRMDMPEGSQVQQMLSEAPVTGPRGGRKRVAKMKVTSMATEVASASRRTNDGVFKCPIPGCGSTFTRHFNLKGHLRSHNDERPYKCLYDGCPKSVVGFARQHDCKRHMLLHEGLRPFECEGCGKKFARLDALTRHHKSEQGQECAISHPLPTNPDGSPMSESQYKAYKAAQKGGGASNAGGGRIKRESSFQGGDWLSGDERTGGEDELELGTGSGMEDYDRF